MVSQPRFSLIGTGFMGKAHAIALRSVGTVYPELRQPVLALLVDSDAETAKRTASAWGFERHSDDWLGACNDPNVDVVDICTPNHLHREMALAAAAAGKHIYCEKPLGLNTAEAVEICEAAEAAGVTTAVGFNYICNPMLELAKSIIDSGEIGDVYSFRGSYQEDYLADPDTSFSWRCLRSEGGSGALNDLGTHLINMAEFLLGPIAGVFGNLATIYEQRLCPQSGEYRKVENEDIAQVIVSFASGCRGTLDISRIATGKKCGLEFELFGSRGSLAFDQERMNEIRFYRTDDAAGRRGYATVLSGPEHPDYSHFCPAPGHGLGINDLKIIEIARLIRAINGGDPVYCNFRNGLRVQTIVDAIEESAAQRTWISTGNKT